MEFTFNLRCSCPKDRTKGRPATSNKSKATLNVRVHEPPDEIECPILQETIKGSTGLECFPRPFSSNYPKLSAITLPCTHTFHAMALVYNWARNCNVLCPVCRAGPKHKQLVMSKLPRDWRYSLSARIRREWKEDRDKIEEENRQAAVNIAANQQPRMLSFSIIMRIEATDSIYMWMGHATAVPGAGGLIFHIPPSELTTIPFHQGERIRVLPFLHVHPLNFFTSLTPTTWFQLGQDDPGLNFTIVLDQGADGQPQRIMHLLYAVNEDIFAQALANSLMILNEL